VSVTETINVALVARDESKHVARTLESVYLQQPHDRYRFDMHVVANACEDDTADVARNKISSFEPRPDMSFSVIELTEAGKNNAINTILALSDDELAIYGDTDALFSSDCFYKVADTLQDPDIWVTGPFSRQIIGPEIVDPTVRGLHRVRQLYNECTRFVPQPVGAMIGFKRALLETGRIPLDALADDRYLTLTAVQKYGLKAVQTIKEASVFTKATSTMEDFIKKGDRIATVSKHFTDTYPELGKLLKQLRTDAARRAPPREEVNKVLIPRLTEEGIDPALFGKWLEMRAAARPRPELLRAGLTWDPIATTK
jgi:cellulose synthase/poly-beta-1,6-N-acetylglucosamine synthase-like glycosyltransferase